MKHWVEINNRIPSLNSKNGNEKKLATFCSTQKYSKKNNKLSNDRIIKLNAIPDWYWGNEEIKTKKTFDESYDKLTQWIEINNKMPNSDSKNEIEKRLGTFCCDQRQNKKNNKLTDDKIMKLNVIPNWHWESEDIFNKNYDEVKQWVEINHKIPSRKSKNETEQKLGNFCSRQRMCKKGGKLDHDKIKKLEQINEWYWTKYN